MFVLVLIYRHFEPKEDVVRGHVWRVHPLENTRKGGRSAKNHFSQSPFVFRTLLMKYDLSWNIFLKKKPQTPPAETKQLRTIFRVQSGCALREWWVIFWHIWRSGEKQRCAEWSRIIFKSAAADWWNKTPRQQSGAPITQQPETQRGRGINLHDVTSGTLHSRITLNVYKQKSCLLLSFYTQNQKIMLLFMWSCCCLCDLAVVYVILLLFTLCYVMLLWSYCCLCILLLFTWCCCYLRNVVVVYVILLLFM